MTFREPGGATQPLEASCCEHSPHEASVERAEVAAAGPRTRCGHPGCNPYGWWRTLSGQTGPYTIPPPAKPNPNAALPRRWSPGGTNVQVPYEINTGNVLATGVGVGLLALPVGAPPTFTFGSAGAPFAALQNAWTYWVCKSAEAWNENPTSDVDLQFNGIQSITTYDSDPVQAGWNAVINNQLIWPVANGGPTGNGRNEVIIVDTISGVGLCSPQACTSMIYDPATGQITECDIIIDAFVAG